jgi:hypothetical protein
MRIFSFSVIALLAVLTAGNMPVARAAETVCKGLATDICKGNSGCSWVNSYKTKKGKQTAGFCRKKATHKSAEPKVKAKG